MNAQPLRVGLIGCGNIADTYLANAPLFADSFRITAVADIQKPAADRIAAKFGLPAVGPDDLLANPAIDLILNLTIPAAHVPVALAAIDAGKHVYLEKPLGVSVGQAQTLLDRATAKGLQVGAAPDTFLGAAHLTALRLIREGAIGTPVGGSAAVIDRGMEMWHPNPGFFYAPGGGPVFDMGPYYLTSLINLLGPVQHVSSHASIGVKSRQVGRGPQAGQPIPVSVPTTLNAILRFAGDVDVAFTASWDVWTHRRSHIEIYGTEGTLVLPDPNWFGGAVELSHGDQAFTVQVDDGPWGAPNKTMGDGTKVADYRGLGLADMARTIGAGIGFRANGQLALDVLRAKEAIQSQAI